MGEITLVRHGQANSAATDEAGYDKLSELGHQQAAWLGDWINAHDGPFDAVFSGSLRHACWSMDTDGIPEENTGSICDPFCVYDPKTQMLLDDEKCKSLGPDTWQKRAVYGEIGRWAWTCETGQQCLCGDTGDNDPYCQWVDNPNYGINSFDNILSAMVTIFQSITLEIERDRHALTRDRRAAETADGP